MVPVSMDNTALLIRDYNSIEQQLLPLRNSESQMHNLDAQVATASAEIHRRQGLLTHTQKDDAHLQKRIHRNENPRFLHYFVCNRDSKVERLKGELQQLQSVEKDLMYKLSTDSTQLATFQQQQQNAHAIVDKKHQLEGQCRHLFDQVVDAQPPTQALQQLRAGHQQQRSFLASEQGLAHAVGNCVQQVKQGLSFFQKAESLYRQAHSVNERAKDVNRREAQEGRREWRDEAVGDDFGADNAQMVRERLERQERDLQCQRDNLINQAHDVAIQAYQLISNAFTTFPAEARVRYPQLCASIGQVAFPRVQGANFNGALMVDAIFGTFGAAMNDASSGCQIQDNMRSVEQCVSMTSEQLGLITAMQNAVGASVHQVEAAIKNLEHNMYNEHHNIFNFVRSAVMAAAPAA